jgi:hypothetical protein
LNFVISVTSVPGFLSHAPRRHKRTDITHCDEHLTTLGIRSRARVLAHTADHRAEQVRAVVLATDVERLIADPKRRPAQRMGLNISAA